MSSFSGRSRTTRGGPRNTGQSELHQLRETVRSLQKDAHDQLSLEMESQASFEHIYTQVRGLRSAFDTLSDVLLEEVDSLRAETSKSFDSLNLRMEKHDRVLENACQDLGVLKRTIDVWGLKERDWAKDNEILKVSHAHNAEWMKTMQRDLMEVKDEMRAVKDDSSVASKDVREEAASLRTLWEQSSNKVNARVRELESSIDRQQVRVLLLYSSSVVIGVIGVKRSEI
jgi:chromosome segregation ATPase